MNVSRYLLSALIVALTCMSSAGCRVVSEFSGRDFQKFSIKCRILGPVAKEMIPFTNGPVVIAYVPVQIVEPEFLQKDRVHLILKEGGFKETEGLEAGASWKSEGSVVDVTVMVNTKSSRYYLYPSMKEPIQSTTAQRASRVADR